MNIYSLTLLQLMISFGLLVMIWMIQILHYPLFQALDEELFCHSMSFHQARISFIVIPLMLTELSLALILLWLSFNVLTAFSFLLVLAIWLSTFLWQVPLHQRLTTTKDKSHCEELVKSNWIRTILWSVKFIICLMQIF